MKEDWLDGDKLHCIKCDRFVESINEEGLCPICEEEEKTQKKLKNSVNPDPIKCDKCGFKSYSLEDFTYYQNKWLCKYCRNKK